MDPTQPLTPKCDKPIKKTFTNIFGATVDNTVHNINYNGNLSTSKTSHNLLRDIIIIALIIGALVIVWRAYLLCQNKYKMSNNGIRHSERSEERKSFCINKMQQTDLPFPKFPQQDQPIQQKHTIQIE